MSEETATTLKLYTPDNLGKRVEVYLSLGTKYPRRWIVRTYSKAPSSRKRTFLNGESGDERCELTETIGLKNCEFFVYEAKRKLNLKLRENGRKDVFAWVIGDLVEPDEVRTACNLEVTYHMRNPFFTDENDQIIRKADMALFTCVDGRFKVFVPG